MKTAEKDADAGKGTASAMTVTVGGKKLTGWRAWAAMVLCIAIMVPFLVAVSAMLAFAGAAFTVAAIVAFAIKTATGRWPKWWDEQ